MFEIVRRAARELLDPPIVQLGPPRTGSTMVWNALRAMFPRRVVLKRHALTPLRAALRARSPLVCTVRHPLDALASSLLRSPQPRTAEVLERHARDLERPFRQIIRLRDDSGVRVLRYEVFSRSPDDLIADLAAFFGVSVSDHTRLQVHACCDIARAERIAGSLGDFSRVDPATQIHGRHISVYRGASGYYGRVLTQQELAAMAPRFAPIMDALGYRP